MKQLIQRYPVLAFFVIIIALGWIAVIVSTAVMPIDAEHEMTVAHVLFVFFIASPSAVGILLTVVVDGREGFKDLFSSAAIPLLFRPSSWDWVGRCGTLL